MSPSSPLRIDRLGFYIVTCPAADVHVPFTHHHLSLAANDAGRLALLRTAYERGTSNSKGNTPYLTTATLNAIQTLAANFETAMRDLSQLTGQRATVMEDARVHAK